MALGMAAGDIGCRRLPSILKRAGVSPVQMPRNRESPTLVFQTGSRDTPCRRASSFSRHGAPSLVLANGFAFWQRLAEMTLICVLQLGTIDYSTGLRLQQKLVDLRKENSVPDVLLVLEHPPVITLGRNARAANVIASSRQLAERGVEVVECDRGGDVTFHGPDNSLDTRSSICGDSSPPNPVARRWE